MELYLSSKTACRCTINVIFNSLVTRPTKCIKQIKHESCILNNI